VYFSSSVSKFVGFIVDIASLSSLKEENAWGSKF
jgi:hypothetical protein